VPTDRFPDTAAFVEAAAAELGRPEAAARARRLAALAAVGRLCGRAAGADAARSADLLATAASLCDGLRVAARAAELMRIDAGATTATARHEADRPGGPTPPIP
jgi:hypothetical protein